jgi:hypothetical protein
MPEQRVHVPGYTYELVDILTVRGSRGLSQTLNHVHAQRIADWAEGDAHDTLAALFVAVLNAEADGAKRLRDEDVDAGTAAVSAGGVPIGTVMALSENEQRVLAQHIERSLDSETSIESAAELIAAQTELTDGTVKRLLYELAQRGVLERQGVKVGTHATGPQPSGVVPNFSERLFAALRNE